MTETPDHPAGPERRRGPFRAGERVQITDVKGRLHTIVLTHDGFFQTQRGAFRHRELIGQPEGTVLHTASGHDMLALRPLLSDYVMSMPRGAAVIYPKDAGQIIQMGDIFPGARVVEAGAGSGALSASLLSAIGPEGRLLSFERRDDFAEIAEANVTSWFGERPHTWDVVVGNLADHLERVAEPGSIDRVVLDMLAPWENIDAVAATLAPGGVLTCYVTTTTQMSKLVEELRGSGRFAEPAAWESMVRSWHLEGLAVRPDHRMVAHTGFLVTARTLAPNTAPPARTRRPAKAAHPASTTPKPQPGEGDANASDPATPAGDTDTDRSDSADVDSAAEADEARVAWDEQTGMVDQDWSEQALGRFPTSEKKIRRVRRDIAKRTRIEQSGMASQPGPTGTSRTPRDRNEEQP